MIETSHDPRDWREAFETSEPGPELNRIRAKFANAGGEPAVALHLDEASALWKRMVAAEERAEELSRVAATLTEREAAATREVKRLRAQLEGADDVQIARRIEWATGRNGRTILDNIRAEGLDVIAVRPEQANA